MIDKERRNIIETIIEREKIRHVGRIRRLSYNPIRTAIYYFFAALSRIRPYKKTFPTLWGTNMTSFLPEGNTFYYYGYCEANLTNFLLHFLKEGDVVLDVGAHVGFYTMLSSLLVGNSGQVHSFEPTPWTYELLRENTKSLPNVFLNNKAVSNKNDMLTFKDYGPGFGAYNTAHEKGSSLKKKAASVTVETVALDDYCKERGMRPTFIKLDAEGYEYEILVGMKVLLREARPIITLEVAGGEEWKDNRKQSIDALLSEKYKPYEMGVDGKISPHSIRDNYRYDNILFIPEERKITI